MSKFPGANEREEHVIGTNHILWLLTGRVLPGRRSSLTFSRQLQLLIYPTPQRLQRHVTFYIILTAQTQLSKTRPPRERERARVFLSLTSQIPFCDSSHPAQFLSNRPPNNKRHHGDPPPSTVQSLPIRRPRPHPPSVRDLLWSCLLRVQLLRVWRIQPFV